MPTVEKAASDYTDYVKKRATVVGRREFSDSLFNSLVLQSSVGRGLGNTPEEPSVSAYGIVSPLDAYIQVSGLDLSNSFTFEWFMRVDYNANNEDVTATGLTVFEDTDTELLDTIFEVHTNEDEFHVHDDVEDIIVNQTLPSGFSGKWYHYALSGTSDSLRVYFNGILADTINSGFAWTNKIFTMGYSFANEDTSFGSLTNYRVTKSALYTGDSIEIPSLPLSGGSLLLLMDSPSTIGKNSGSDTLSITVTGSPVWQAGPISYSSSYGVISGFTDDDYLLVPTADLGMGGDFTVECFAFIPETSLIGVFSSGDWGIYIDEQYISWYTNFVLKEPYVGKWTHLAMVRRSNVDYMYVDGVNVGNYEKPIGGILYIGYYNDDGAEPFTNGKISNFRVSSTAKYTETFTPSLPLIIEDDTMLLLTDSLTNDVSGVAVVTQIGNVTLTTESISYTPYQP